MAALARFIRPTIQRHKAMSAGLFAFGGGMHHIVHINARTEFEGVGDGVVVQAGHMTLFQHGLVNPL